MQKAKMYTPVVLVLGLALLSAAYFLHVYTRHSREIRNALSRCSARTSVVLAGSNFDPASLGKSLRGMNEAIVYVEGIAEDVHVHQDGKIRFNDEQSFRYLKLCSDTLRAERAFYSAMQTLNNASSPGPGGVGLPQDAVALQEHEQAYSELVRQHGELRRLLTELRNENEELAAKAVLEELVDLASIEHAEREIDFFYSKAR